MSPPDRADSQDPLKPLASLDGDPAFNEPWQAEALAIADTLVKQGMFDASTWSTKLGEKLKQAEQAGESDNAMTYYNAVLAALEELVADHSALDQTDMLKKRKDWEAAYLSTPHGQPVILK